MLKWVAIVVAGAGLGYAAVYFALISRPAPQPAPGQPAAAVQPVAPAVLPQVVEVTDTDPLLDPLPGQPAGVPFEVGEPPAPAKVNAAPAPIPPAVD
jgi:hypothetical protein